MCIGLGLLTLIRQRDEPGRASTKVTAIYLQMVGEEQRRLVMEAWEHQTGPSPV